MYIGIDVGGTNLVAGLVDQEGTILHKSACPVNRSWSAEELVSQLAQLSVCAAQEGGISLEDVEGAGAGIPGLVDNEAGIVVKTPNMPFRDTPFRELFQRKLNIPVHLGNDADCAAAGEYWAGAAKGCDPVVMVTLGTGIGTGLVRGGKLYTGLGGAGMEAGHLMTHPNGLPCGCGGLGCWEQYGSATALIRMTRSAMEASPKSLLWEVCGGSLDRVEGRTPFQAARAGDETALQVLEEYQKELSYGLISLSNILFPEVICLGGGVSSADSDLLLDPVRELVHKGCFDKDRLPKVVRASLGNDAGVVGAAMLCRMA